MGDNNKPNPFDYRPQFPKRAIVTAGMPYGNKTLHFGHIGGVFVHADVYSRFLKDRIGEDNVIFVSGTDCYGSPIVETYNRLVRENKFEGSIQDFVKQNHISQKETLDKYNIGIDLFATSGLNRTGEIHKQICNEFIKKLYKNGCLEKRSTLQFYDSEEEVFLNGRQVQGRCPIPNCKSEKAYADECSLGHAYEPKDLINPVSVISGKKPEMREVTNWYIDLAKYKTQLEEWVNDLSKVRGFRKYVLSIMKEFLEPPVTYIKLEFKEDLKPILSKLPLHEYLENDKSIILKYEKLDDRETGCEILVKNNIRHRNGKTLTPFRLTGNVDWGLPVDEIDGLKDLTFWVWPESLIAPISFTAAYLESKGQDLENWKQWWSSDDAKVYQFIGEDNVYFYTLAEMSMFMGTHKNEPKYKANEGDLHFPHIISNKHVLYMDKKASSSSNIKPPMAEDLLDYYTSEQLRAHFFSLGLGNKSVSFKPKPLNPNAKEKDSDPVMKEGNLLSNALNRVARSCFYTTQKYFNNILPYGKVDEDIVNKTNFEILKYEKKMQTHEFHSVMAILDKYIRNINKYWNKKMQLAAKDEDMDLIKETLVNTFYMLRVAIVLMHPIAPKGCELILDHLNMDERFFDWKYIFEDIYFFMDKLENHEVKGLKPRFDFFDKHESQYK